MKKINNDEKLKFLKKEYKKTLQDLKDIRDIYNSCLDVKMSFPNVLNRVISGSQSEADQELFCVFLKCNKYLYELETRIKRLEAIKKYEDQVDECYFAYLTQQEDERMMDGGDASAKCFENYIPDEVETGYIPVGEAEEQHGIKIVKLDRGPVYPIEKLERTSEKITYGQLANAEANRRDSMDQSRRRRANGSDAFNGRYGQ